MTLSKKTKIELVSEVKKLQRKIELLQQKKEKPVAKTVKQIKVSGSSKWESYFKNAEHTILVLDKNGFIIEDNDVINSPRRNQIIGQPAYKFIDKEFHAIVKKTLKKVFTTGKPQRYEISRTGTNGQKTFYSS